VFTLTTTELVTAVVTVQYAVALVSLLYTLPEVRAFELCRRTSNGRTAFFVLVVETVVVAVAHPGLRDAMAGPRTGELEQR